jgi:hypothetical protein
MTFRDIFGVIWGIREIRGVVRSNKSPITALLSACGSKLAKETLKNLLVAPRPKVKLAHFCSALGKKRKKKVNKLPLLPRIITFMQ